MALAIWGKVKPAPYFHSRQLISTLFVSVSNRNGRLDYAKMHNYDRSINVCIFCLAATKSLGGSFVKQNEKGQKQGFSVTLDHHCWHHQKYFIIKFRTRSCSNPTKNKLARPELVKTFIIS